MDLSNNIINDFYQMNRIRYVEETIANKYSEQEMRCPIHLSIGQEATAVGVISNLTQADKIYSTHRCHAHYLAKGGNLNAMISEIHGKASGCCGGRGGSMHLFDEKAGIIASLPIVASVIPLAVGSALTFKLKKNKKIVAVFFGDGAMEEGVFHESANFAKVHNLPVLFVCENNLYSVYTELNQRQPNDDLTRLAKAYNIESIRCDGNDIAKVKLAGQQATEYIRAQQGPFFLQLDTFRQREHCGPNSDDELGYRTEDQITSGFLNDPIILEKNKLIKLGLINDKLIEEIEKEIKIEIEKAFQFTKNDSFPSLLSAKDYVYAN